MHAQLALHHLHALTNTAHVQMSASADVQLHQPQAALTSPLQSSRRWHTTRDQHCLICMMHAYAQLAGVLKLQQLIMNINSKFQTSASNCNAWPWSDRSFANIAIGRPVRTKDFE
jgi:hypothetical protein